MKSREGVIRIVGYMTSLLCVLNLTACTADSYRNQMNQEHYILDIGTGEICLEKHVECYRLSLIVPSYREHLIAQGYGLPNKAYSWSAEQLVELLLHPPNAQYQPEKLSSTRYRLPPHFATHSVWDVLALEQYDLYERGDDRFGGLEFMPTPRRY
jgi:hypothetical protein